MVARETPKVSYCTTCKGRLHHLMQTLSRNLEAEKDNPNVEFVVLDYGSDDGLDKKKYGTSLGEWIHKNYQKEIDTGRIRYARTESEYFKMAHAKNMAHRIATGDILVNLDADNTIVKNYSCWITKQFSKSMDICIGMISHDKWGRARGAAQKALVKSGFTDARDKGTCGRIIISRENFDRMGGYDESRYEGYGNDDNDFLLRAQHMGLKSIRCPIKYWGNAHEHDEVLRHELMSPLVQYLEVPALGIHPRANLNETGCGIVRINSVTVDEIKPLKAGRRPEPKPVNFGSDSLPKPRRRFVELFHDGKGAESKPPLVMGK